MVYALAAGLAQGPATAAGGWSRERAGDSARLSAGPAQGPGRENQTTAEKDQVRVPSHPSNNRGKDVVVMRTISIGSWKRGI